MTLSGVFDVVTKGVAALGALAGVYAFATKNADDIVPVVLTVWGLGYAAILGLCGLAVLIGELLYWKGPVHRRPSYFYRVQLTRPPLGKLPTNWELIARTRRRDQVLTALFGLVVGGLLAYGTYYVMAEELSDGFPVRHWTTTWLFGSLALAVTVVVAVTMLWAVLKKGRTASRKRRCPSCGELCPRQSRVCPHCQEWSPAWKLLYRPQSPSG